MQQVLNYFHELDAEAKAAAITALRVVLILIIAWALQIVAARLIHLFRGYMQRRSPASEELARIETLARVFRNLAAVIIVIVAGTLVLGELGISVAPILATAGVAGIAIGFGAQSLIKDYFNGVFLLLDDQIREGDVVEVAGLGGFVEEVTLRYVRLRDMDSHVYYVPNGEIKMVINRTRGYATPLFEIRVSYREDPDEVLAIMREVAAAQRADPKWKDVIRDELEVIGVDRWEASGMVLRARLKVIPPIEQWNVKREYLKRLKKAFDTRDIEIPLPHLTVYAGRLKDGSAPSLPVRTDAPLSR
jgi:small conductance mechanosensitive channel